MAAICAFSAAAVASRTLASQSSHIRSEQNGGDTMKRVTIAVLALAVLVAVWVYHRDHAGLQATPACELAAGTSCDVTRTITIPGTEGRDITLAPPPPGAAPAMTALQAWQKLSQSDGSISATVHLGLFSYPRAGPPPVLNQPAPPFSQNRLAYGYYWSACVPPGANLPAAECWNWYFIDANTGALIWGDDYINNHLGR